MNSISKKCSKCRQEKLLFEYHKNKNAKDGLTHYCKLCATEKTKQWYEKNKQRQLDNARSYRKNNIEKVREFDRGRYKGDREISQKNHAKLWREENPERTNELKRSWAIRNKEHVKEQKKDYYHKNKEIFTAIRQNRRARVKGNGGRITKKEVLELRSLCGNKCLCCGSTDDLSLDHVIPLALGGGNTIQNAQILCKSCNSKKHTKIIDYRK